MLEVIPFLCGQSEAPDETPGPSKNLCTQAICSILGVSRNFLYGIKRRLASKEVTENELTSIADTAGVRLRQHHRTGDRGSFPKIDEMQSFECGCAQPCFSDMPIMRLQSE